MKRWMLRFVVLAAIAAVVWAVWSWISRDDTFSETTYRPARTREAA